MLHLIKLVCFDTLPYMLCNFYANSTYPSRITAHGILVTTYHHQPGLICFQAGFLRSTRNNATGRH